MTMELPFILAGPVVRRARRDQVLFWLATSKKAALGVEVYRTKARELEADTSIPIGEGTNGRQRKVRDGLWVHLIPALPNSVVGGEFPQRQLLFYDVLELNVSTTPTATPGVPLHTGKARRLPVPERRARLLASKPAVLSTRLRGTGKRLRDWVNLDDYCLGNLAHPSFVLQTPGRNELTALFGSCRKLHGPGDDAALAALGLLTQKALDPKERQTALFLMGDQIYADDVHDELLPVLMDLDDAFGGGTTEPLPGVDKLERKAGARGKLATSAGFTSSDQTNHAFTLSEFAALYLLAWNPELWRATKNAKLHEARTGSGAMRRLLANVPTYMIFDDHEVTDDWNLDALWRNDVGKRPLGRRVIANGLAAFALFQGWGNDPDAPDLDTLLDLIERRMENPSADSALDQEYERTLLAYRSWSFATPTTPKTLFLDTRTARAASAGTRDWRWRLKEVSGQKPEPQRDELMRSGHPSGVPSLLLPGTAASEAWSLLGRIEGEPLIIVAPGPVVTPETYEALIAMGHKAQETYRVDFESWRANPLNYLAFFELVAALGADRCVILSGDVHFGHTATADMIAGGRSFRVLQCTSSAMKNEHGALILNALRGGIEVPLPGLPGAPVRALPGIVAVSPPPSEVRRLWWRIAGGETESLDHTAGGPDLDALEQSLRDTNGSPTLEEHVHHLDLGFSGQGMVLGFNNVGELRCAARITSQHFTAAGGSLSSGSSVSL